jgi:predicted tellurium resistance membrane protein TerC
MFDVFASPGAWISLATLTFLEIILGIDNVVFVSLAAGRLPPEKQSLGRSIGIYSGAVLRIAMLFGLVWLTGLSHAVLFHLPEFFRPLASPTDPNRLLDITLEDLVLLAGGVFLLWKGTREIDREIVGVEEGAVGRKTDALGAVVVQMILINIVFSLDSVLTAVGMTRDIAGGPEARLTVMAAAVVLSTFLMLWASGWVSRFLDANPTTKMLALSFIMLVGVALVADGLGFHIPRGYLYFAIAFSLGVEALNILVRKQGKKTGKP